LETLRKNLEHPDDYEVAPYPCAVGIPDFYLRRLHKNAPAALWLSFVEDGEADAQSPADFPFQKTATSCARRGPDGLVMLLDTLERTQSDIVVLVGPGVVLSV